MTKTKTYALVGKSGTGKSYRAMTLCREMNIESLVDDGLYIYKGMRFTGKSAKGVPTTIGAIKTALFTEQEHMEQVRKLIAQTKPKSVLILGTSLGMVERIRERLGFPKIEKIIKIEDITSEGERKAANKQRTLMGKHIVPIPSAQLKRQLSGYIMSPLRTIRGWGARRGQDGEKTVVRPAYSYMGKFIISDRVIKDIVSFAAADIEGVDRIHRVIAEKPQGEVRITIIADFNSRGILIEEAIKLQKECVKQIEEMTAFSVESVRIEAKGVA